MDQRVTDVVAPEEGREDRARGQGPVRGDVLDAVHCQIGLPGQQSGVHLLGERPLALHRAEVTHPLVARRLDGDHLCTGAGVELGQFGADTLHLGECHGRVTGDDADQIDGHGAHDRPSDTGSDGTL
ncbi:hypothetical protein Smic_31440 [Streptomyces microflavus]|uniref:Uncharacterized protein n=1 Tax=Streptomyces microflavus TaxID=1919 RepID=A0A7J0CQH7_STRMI|nr:hypothetical protein Smic_31440 [Streptomyces microflavus]